MRSTAHAAGTPERIGARYEVLSELGRGGMAAVYHVRDGALGRDLALKQLLPIDGDRGAGKLTALFEREFYRLAQLSHPRVIQVYDYGIDVRGPFYTMELLAGGDLKESAPLEYRSACALMLDVCSCLSLLHSRNLVHRDISPRNIRCTQDGHAKLIDFGAMVPMGPCAHTVGTPAFVAPEVLHRLTLDARTDLFSLGATLYYTLTGRSAFGARDFSELRNAWAHRPVPASEHMRGIPPALDALLASLLSIDPAKRPRTAFEVSQRLAAIAGIEHAESIEVSQAYLSTPSMVGRDAALLAFRQRMRRALHDHGGGLLIASAPGLGRSRMLDACTLEAKTLGAFVVRANTGASTETPFASAQQLAEQLLEALPHAARQAAVAAGVEGELFADGRGPTPASAAEATGPEPRLRDFTSARDGRAALQAALSQWFLAVARDHALLVAVDDVHRIDHASGALLAALAHGAGDRRLLVLVTTEIDTHADAPVAVRVLLEQCRRVELAPLGRDETDTLFASIFGNVPHVGLLSDRIHEIAAGSPRESIALAQHMLDTGLIAYRAGHWTLPARLGFSDLPASIEEAFAARVAQLPSLARRLVEAQALCVSGALTRDDYAALAGSADAQQLEQAIFALIGGAFVSSDGRVHTLANRAWAAALVAAMPDAERRERHRALAEMHQRRSSPDLFVAHHLFAAGLHERALDRIDAAFASIDVLQQGGFQQSIPHHAAEISAMLERALELAETLQRRPCEINKLRGLLSVSAMFAGNAMFHRWAPAWLAQLERDSGLADHRALGPELPADQRLMQALQTAAARHEATPEPQRGQPVQEAIKGIAAYVLIAIVVGSRTRDTRLLASLPGLLEALLPLSSFLVGLQATALATCEFVYRAQPRRAAARWITLYARLDSLTGAERALADTNRLAIAYALGELEAASGLASALKWIEVLDQHPLQQVNAMYLRRIVCLQQADSEGAERYRKQAEVLAVQASARQLFESPLRTELVAHFMARDLTSLKQVVDRIAQVAAEYPGWVAQHLLGLGYFHRLRGDFVAARDAFERCIAAGSPEHVDPPACIDVWIGATAGRMACLCHVGRPDEAVQVGEAALARCRELEVDGWMEPIERELALAESTLGQCARAAARIDALIEQQLSHGVTGLHLGISYEARARVAIAAHEGAVATRFAELAAREYQHGRSSNLAAHYEQLLDAARRAGVDVSAQFSGFESSVLGTNDTHAEDDGVVAGALAGAIDPSDRARRALELLCDADQASAGHLYLTGPAGLTRAASHGAGAPDAALDRFVEGYFRQQLDDVGMTAGVTAATHMLSVPTAAAWTDEHGTVHDLVIIACKHGGAVVHVGVAVLLPQAHAQRSNGARCLAAAVGVHLLKGQAALMDSAAR